MTDITFEKEAWKFASEIVEAVREADAHGWPPSQLNVTIETLLEEYLERIDLNDNYL